MKLNKLQLHEYVIKKAKQIISENEDQSAPTEDKMVVPKEILRQLGGSNRLNAMTGAYNFAGDKNSLSFRIKNPKANYIKITLNSMDTYDVEIGRIRGNDYKIIDSTKGLYNDMLKGYIEKITGMYLSL